MEEAVPLVGMPQEVAGNTPGTAEEAGEDQSQTQRSAAGAGTQREAQSPRALWGLSRPSNTQCAPICFMKNRQRRHLLMLVGTGVSS